MKLETKHLALQIYSIILTIIMLIWLIDVIDSYLRTLIIVEWGGSNKNFGILNISKDYHWANMTTYDNHETLEIGKRLKYQPVFEFEVKKKTNNGYLLENINHNTCNQR